MRHYTFRYMFLSVSQSKTTQMTVENLARVFGPTLVGYSTPNPEPIQMLDETHKQAMVCAFMYSRCKYSQCIRDVNLIQYYTVSDQLLFIIAELFFYFQGGRKTVTNIRGLLGTVHFAFESNNRQRSVFICRDKSQE